MRKLILASSSPRRLDLLKQIGYTPDEVLPADLDETVLKNELPKDHCLRLAIAKAQKIAETYPNDIVIGSDSTVALGRRIFGKPEDADETRKFMKMLSGRRHKAITAVCVISAGKQSVKVVETVVQFKRLDNADIEGLVKSGDWEGKCGAYSIQGYAARFIKKIIGTHSNVMGLPLYETAALLKTAVK